MTKKRSIEQEAMKLINYKGNVVARWKAPRTKRQVIYAIKKLLKFYYRCKASGLLTKQLVEAIKKYGAILHDMAGVKLLAYGELALGLQEIARLKIEDLEEEIVTEKERKHEDAICSLCRTRLVYPAYIVYRKGLDVVKTSEPVGIRCLHRMVGRINDLITELSVGNIELAA